MNFVHNLATLYIKYLPEFLSYFLQNLFPSNFLQFANISFQKEISFKVEALPF